MQDSIVCKELRTLKWRDVTGPKKYKLLSKSTFQTFFQNLPNASTVQDIWNSFMKLNKVIHSQVISSVGIKTFKQDAKMWLQLFLSIKQSTLLHICMQWLHTYPSSCSYIVASYHLLNRVWKNLTTCTRSTTSEAQITVSWNH